MKRLSIKGQGLVEVLVAVSILSIVAMLIGYISFSFNKSGVISYLGGTCSSTSAASQAVLSALGNKDTILDAFVPLNPAGTGRAANAYGLNLVSEQPTAPRAFAGVDLFNSTWGLPIISSSSTPTVNNAQMIMGAVSVVQAMVNSDHTYCSNSTGRDVSSVLFPNGRPEGVDSVMMKIQPYDLVTNTVQACPAVGSYLSAAPRRLGSKPAPGYGNASNTSATDGFVIGGDSDLGYLITFTVNESQGTTTKICNTQLRVAYQRDTQNISGSPTLITAGANRPENGSGSALNYQVSGTYPPGIWNSNTTSARVSFQFPSPGLEAGSVLVCKDGQTGTSYSCNSLILRPMGGGAALAAPQVSWDSTNSIITFQFSGLAANGNPYRMTISSVDTAGNISATASVQFANQSYCDSGTIDTVCYVTTSHTIPNGANITGLGNVIFQSGGSWRNTTNLATFSITLPGTGNTCGSTPCGQVVVQGGGSIVANVTIDSYSLQVDSGGQINATGLGYLGGRRGTNPSPNGMGPGGGVAYAGTGPGGGGGHGGVGGAGKDAVATAAGGVSNDSASNPTDFGSGGGSCTSASLAYCGGASNGGGRIKITTATSVTINQGLIEANGENLSFTNGGGGAGGTVWISAGTIITGTWPGHIYAKASLSNLPGTGGGGGGRVYIKASNIYNSAVIYDGSYNNRGTLVTPATATDTLPGPGSYYSDIGGNMDAICDSGTWATTCTVNTMKAIGQNLMPNLTGANLSITSTGGFYVSNYYDQMTFNLTGTLTNAGLIRGNIKSLIASNLTMPSGGNIFGNIGGPNAVTQPGINVPTVSIASGAYISASGWGGRGGMSNYTNGYRGTGTGTAVLPANIFLTSAGGSSYGGQGSTGAGGGPGVTYGSSSNPVDYGSGGTGNMCESGGGIIRISGTNVTIDGGVYSNTCLLMGSWAGDPQNDAGCKLFLPQPNCGGASGGTVRVSATGALNGSGLIAANGGIGGQPAGAGVVGGGGGGGGRVYINAPKPYTGSVTYYAGKNYETADLATKGSFYSDNPSMDSICDAGSWVTTCTVDSGKALGQNQLTLAGGALTINANGILRVGDPTDWLDLNLTGAASVSGKIIANIKSFQASSLSVASGGQILGSVGSTTAGYIGIRTTGDINIAAGGLISGDGAGSPGGFQYYSYGAKGMGTGGSPGSSNAATGGGGYGGAGGASTLAGGPSFGPATAAGSGAGASYGMQGQPGASGGGVVKLVSTGGNLNNDGLISANGLAGTSVTMAGGGGAGGGINIQINKKILGTGSITAQGGPGGAGASYFDIFSGTFVTGPGGGGGGGGRVAIDAASPSDPLNINTNGGAAGGGAGMAGGPGWSTITWH